MKQLPTSISYRNSLVAHYADGSAVALSELSADERAAVLHEAVRRYNEHGMGDDCTVDALVGEA